MKVWAYVLTWNEELMLPYYLKHYSQFCDKIIVYDNESNDKSKEIIESYPNTEIRTYGTEGTINAQIQQRIRSGCIADARGKADYVIVSDCDEFVYHPNMRQFLEDNLGKFSVFYPSGFQMATQEFPVTVSQIYDQVKTGIPDPWYSKPLLVNPNLVDEIYFVDGCHEFMTLDGKIKAPIYHPVPEEIRPEGSYKDHKWGKWKMMTEYLYRFNEEPLKLLHYKFLGAEYVNNRYKQYIERLSSYNKDKNLSTHYAKAIESNSVQTQIDDILIKSIKVNLK